MGSIADRFNKARASRPDPTPAQSLTPGQVAAARNVDPVAAAERISSDYYRYLRSLMMPRDPAVSAEFRRALEANKDLTRGPLLELTPTYAPGKSARELIAEGVLEPGFADLEHRFNLDRPLYAHQEKALRKVVNGRNIIVSTGTGSGKTESFLLPIVNELIRQRDAGELTPGVRALLLYPMNALANDQIARLRELLADVPDVTFGRYTGETEATENAARRQYRTLHGKDAVPLPNERISRDRIKAAPPHILVTNYAMLEYLLLRPDDTPLFDGIHGKSWKYLVVDEAHMYAGAKGSEIAMLLRRLTDRVSSNGQLQCIATSASLDGGPERVCRFGSDIFHQPFEWRDDDPATQDIVYGQVLERPTTATWSLAEHLEPAQWTLEALDRVLREQAGNRSVYDTLNEERHIVEIRSLLGEQSRTLRELAEALWPDQPPADTMSRVHALVLLASTTVSDGSPVFSARYHMFVRATDGAFLSWESGLRPHVQLQRHERTKDGRPVYELGCCRDCGATHIYGCDDHGMLLPPGEATKPYEAGWFALEGYGDELPLLDEDDAIDGGPLYSDPDKSPTFTLCTRCGKLDIGVSGRCQECRSANVTMVRAAATLSDKSQNSEDTSSIVCHVCGHHNPKQIRRLLTDNNAAPAVVATSLYQVLPESSDPVQAGHIGGGRKVLAFSDSRQAAAYAAPYLEKSYERFLGRRLLTQSVDQLTSSAPYCTVDEVAATAKAIARQRSLWGPDQTGLASERIHTMLHAELTSLSRRLSMEGLRRWKIELDPERLRQSNIYATLVDTFQGVQDTICTATAQADPDFDRTMAVEYLTSALLNVLAQDLRNRGALKAHDLVQLDDFLLAPRKGQYSFRKDGGGDSKTKTYSWIPAGHATNLREQLVGKLLDVLEPRSENAGRNSETRERRRSMCHEILAAVLDGLSASGFLISASDKAGEALDPQRLRITQGDDATWFQCTTCHTVTAFNVLGLCPNGRCDGHLRKLDAGEDLFYDEHYQRLARHMEFIPLSAREHTAQLDKQKAADVQGKFVEGELNMLSCSTTFELGVDVGDLQTVFMRNVPPRTANYVQRAGRAGRRAGSAAFVVTYARRGSHDFTVFEDPAAMIDGRMPAPVLKVDNERIAARHLYSIVFAAFLREQAQQGRTWKTIGEFCKGVRGEDARGADSLEGTIEPGYADLHHYVGDLPAEVVAACRRVMPATLHEKIDSGEVFRGYRELWREVYGHFTNDVEELQSVLTNFEDDGYLRANAVKRNRANNALSRSYETLVSEQLISYLSRHNLLPKYGFPVDTVELKIGGYGRGSGGLQLSRDLQLGISDYAPGRSVVADGKVWTSTGLIVYPHRGLLEYEWRECKYCHHVEMYLLRPGEKCRIAHSCPACGALLPYPSSVFVEPRFGFVADTKAKAVTLTPPQRRWRRTEFVSDYGKKLQDVRHGNLRVSGWTHATMGLIERGEEGMGFKYCAECGYCAPFIGSEKKARKHRKPRSGRDCFERTALVSLGHTFQTDIARIPLEGMPNPDLKAHPADSQNAEHDQDAESARHAEDEFWERAHSALYAIVEAAAAHLEINRDDIGGTVSSTDSGYSLVLYDTVPGGAGICRDIVANFPAVLEAAYERVEKCTCGEETSCYSCLRSYANQRFHDILQRRRALEYLGVLRRQVAGEGQVVR